MGVLELRVSVQMLDADVYTNGKANSEEGEGED